VSVVSNPIYIEVRTVWWWIYKKTHNSWVANHVKLGIVSEIYTADTLYVRTLHELKHSRETPKYIIHGMVIWRQGQIPLWVSIYKVQL